jgi:hypothetical protein
MCTGRPAAGAASPSPAALAIRRPALGGAADAAPLARLAAGAAGRAHGRLLPATGAQVIKEVDDALQGWHTGGRFKDQGILEQARPPAGAPATWCARRRAQARGAVTFRGGAAQVESKDHRWAY